MGIFTLPDTTDEAETSELLERYMDAQNRKVTEEEAYAFYQSAHKIVVGATLLDGFLKGETTVSWSDADSDWIWQLI